MAPTMASTCAAASASAARSALSLPLPPSAAAKSLILASSAPNALPLSLTILRKNKSRLWIPVVPSYRLSIFASLMYCSIG